MTKSAKLVRFEFIEVDNDTVKIRDQQQGVVVDVYFKWSGIYCNTCKLDTCPHITYALTVTKVREIVMKKIKQGWNLPEPDV
ncbi:MAG: hypothetical protein LBI09_02195 [Nitrososphaerota archaeon]|jgi:hypothetical protein|nr:hypothetical protein [Nitrososphaerota archaeon]